MARLERCVPDRHRFPGGAVGLLGVTSRLADETFGTSKQSDEGPSCRNCCWMPLVVAVRRRRCPDFTRVAHRATGAGATRPTRRPSRRSSRSCVTPVTACMDTAYADSSACERAGSVETGHSPARSVRVGAMRSRAGTAVSSASPVGSAVRGVQRREHERLPALQRPWQVRRSGTRAAGADHVRALRRLRPSTRRLT
jgi:hypothetical protein